MPRRQRWGAALTPRLAPRLAGGSCGVVAPSAAAPRAVHVRLEDLSVVARGLSDRTAARSPRLPRHVARVELERRHPPAARQRALLHVLHQLARAASAREPRAPRVDAIPGSRRRRREAALAWPRATRLGAFSAARRRRRERAARRPARRSRRLIVAAAPCIGQGRLHIEWHGAGEARGRSIESGRTRPYPSPRYAGAGTQAGEGCSVDAHALLVDAHATATVHSRSVDGQHALWLPAPCPLCSWGCAGCRCLAGTRRGAGGGKGCGSRQDRRRASRHHECTREDRGRELGEKHETETGGGRAGGGSQVELGQFSKQVTSLFVGAQFFILYPPETTPPTTED